jgi:hypothetical protein
MPVAMRARFVQPWPHWMRLCVAKLKKRKQPKRLRLRLLSLRHR